MQTPVEIAYRHCEPSEELRAEIDAQIRRLEKFGDRITSCRVVVEGPQTRHRSGEAFKVDLFIALPERKEVAVNRTHDAPEREHALVAICRAFDEAIRKVGDDEREMSGQVKGRLGEGRGRVTKFVAGEDYGFLETPDGREIYFHRNAVLDGAFNRLTVGSEVRFAEEEGEKGAQASTVHLVGERHAQRSRRNLRRS